MSRIVIVLLRALQIVAAVVNLVLIGLVVNWYLARSSNSPPSSFNFLLFAPSFSIVSVLYLELCPRYERSAWAAHPYISLAVEATNTVFYFGGFIAVAILLSRLVFCEGTVCAVARATSVLAAAEFVAWIATTMMQAKDIFKNGVTVTTYKREPGALAAAGAAVGHTAEGSSSTAGRRMREVLSFRQINSGFDFGLKSPRSPRTPQSPVSVQSPR